MENELEFYRTQRIRVLNLISDLNKELLVIISTRYLQSLI